MSTFNDLLHTLKEICDEKNKRIEFLEGRIEGLTKERSILKQQFLDGEFDLLMSYYNNHG